MLLLHAPSSLLLLRHSIALHRLLLLSVALHGLGISLNWLLPVALGLHRLRVALGLHRLPITLSRLLSVTLNRLLSVSLGLSRLLAVGLRLHRLLSVSLRLLTVSLSLRLHAPGCLLLLRHAVALHRLSIATITLWLLAWLLWLSGGIGSHGLWLSGCRLSRRCLSWLRCLNLLEKIVLLKVATKLVVVDVLLKTDESVVELDVELSALLQKHLQVIGDEDCFVDLLEKLALGGIVAHLVK